MEKESSKVTTIMTYKRVQGYPFFQGEHGEANKYLAAAREATDAENKLLTNFNRVKTQQEIVNTKHLDSQFDINKLGYKRLGLEETPDI